MDAYIIGGYRSAVAKAPRGGFRFLRADDLGEQVIRRLMSDFPQLDKERIDDVIVGNATPEAEQGLNLGRMVSLMGLDTEKVPGMTVNRYCASGLETIAIASAKIHAGIADCIIAGGIETMTPIPFGGWRLVPNARVAKNNPEWYWGMGLTAEAVAKEFKISREDQDAFAVESHARAAAAIDSGAFASGITPITVNEVYLDDNEKRQERQHVIDTDEGVRRGTNPEALAKLRPVFAEGGSVTAGNSSQTSDGAAFVMVVSERMLKELNVEPMARLKSYHVSGLEPRIMGVGPIYAVPEALKKAGLTQADIARYELNEAFASQSVAVLRELDLDPSTVNVHGGAIALGHPLGCTGAKLTVQLLNELKTQRAKHGIVTMCVGTGQGAAGVFEML
ncbi:MAG TPA: acetyl-CoA C-acyltransferase [Flavobacteriales bacterium]|nr:acetyl-CoA C-acyltransferase [Flavobacteriales bacterium]HCL45889.1 acetyl-CoA C-acyltransferase [Flavobacteriales bacterium]|tara:strand:+ start:1106 stop:2281 length:1176 start_codon:yes stop_codon:yes gene_type:complete